MRLFNADQFLKVTIIFTFFYASTVSGILVTSAGQIPAANQTWGFGPSERCVLLAHKSTIVKNDQQHILVIEGGFGSIMTKVNGAPAQVRDLSPFTAAFDLSKDFDTPGLVPSWFYRKPYNSTQRLAVTNHGGLWKSADGTKIRYQGGHYLNNTYWSDSLYHVDKSEIPGWTLWEMDVNNHQAGWKDITNNTKGHEYANRTFAGAAVTVPELGKSYWLGGVLDDTTSATSPNNTLQTTSQMLIYNESSSTVSRVEYYSAGATAGYYQGNLVHLPIGSKNGYLISLMSLTEALNAPWIDSDGDNGNAELADSVTLNTIPMFDLETETWFLQSAAWFTDQIPPPRTRFCSAVFHDETDNTWDLWVHGGQLTSDGDQGVREIYVLSMPSFIWTKVETTLSDTNLIRSHTCHAVGSQFVIVGGSPPSVVEPPNSTCDPEYIKVLNIGEKSISWQGSFTTKSQYRTPTIIRNVVNGRKMPISGFTTTKLQTDFEYKTKSASSRIGPIVGGVVGGLLVLAIIGFFVWRHIRNRGTRRDSSDAEGTTTITVRPKNEDSSTGASTPPEVVTTAARPEAYPNFHRRSEVPESPPAREPLAQEPMQPKPLHELESPDGQRMSPAEQRYSRPTTDYRY